jgi:hypothetical protein
VRTARHRLRIFLFLGRKHQSPGDIEQRSALRCTFSTRVARSTSDQCNASASPAPHPGADDKLEQVRQPVVGPVAVIQECDYLRGRPRPPLGGVYRRKDNVLGDVVGGAAVSPHPNSAEDNTA